MSPSWVVRPVAGAALLAVLAVVWLSLDHRDTAATRPEAAGPAVVTPGRVVHVESDEPGTTFLPLGSGPVDGSTLSAQRAYNLLVSDSAKLQLIPATVQPYYGLLTDGSASPMELRTRVWAFATVSRCLVVGGVPGAGDPTPSPPPAQRCRIWEFVNARSGRDLGVVTQEVLPD